MSESPVVAPPLTFLWHDYETFGANVRRDRPAQFAAMVAADSQRWARIIKDRKITAE